VLTLEVLLQNHLHAKARVKKAFLVVLKKALPIEEAAAFLVVKR
jgi:hypothetical protein